MGRGALAIQKSAGSGGGPATLLYWDEGQSSFGGNFYDSWQPKSAGSTTVNDPWIPVANITPDITTGAVVNFGSFPAGRYQVYYVEGALQYQDVTGPWWLNAAGIYGYRVLHSGGNAELEGPYTTYTPQASQADVETANAGAVIEFDHAGGTIGMYLHDTPLTDNKPGSPNPTFELVGLPTTINNPVHALIQTRGKGSLVLSDGISAAPEPSVFGQLKSRFPGGYDFSGGKAVFQSQVSGANPVNAQDFVTLAYFNSNYFSYSAWRASFGVYAGEYFSKFTPNSSETNVDAVIEPKGTGALQGQEADGSSAGGLIRGNYAVDWQLARPVSDRVASGDYSVIAGGQNNKAAGVSNAVGGGNGNSVSGIASVIAGGYSNAVGNDYSFIGGGNSNVVSGYRSTVGGGQVNQISGHYAVIAGGVNNTITGDEAAVVGGQNNTANGYRSVVLGGTGNLSQNQYTITGGANAAAHHDGAMVIASLNSGGAASTADDECTLKFPGGYRFLGGPAFFESTVAGDDPVDDQDFVTKIYGDANYKKSSVLFDHFADGASSSTDGTEDDLYSDTLVANRLAANGEKVTETEHIVTVASATATRQIKKYFGGTLIFDSGALTLALGTDFTLTTLIIRESSSVVRCSVSAVTTSASTIPYSTYTRITGLTLTDTQVIKTTGIAAGAGAAAADIVAVLATAKWDAAA